MRASARSLLACCATAVVPWRASAEERCCKAVVPEAFAGDRRMASYRLPSIDGHRRVSTRRSRHGATRASRGSRPPRAFDELCEQLGTARIHRREEVAGPSRSANFAALLAAVRQALEPDLVILDEFQRFKHLLSRRRHAAASLARAFSRRTTPMGTAARAKSSCSSATPYSDAHSSAGDGRRRTTTTRTSSRRFKLPTRMTRTNRRARARSGASADESTVVRRPVLGAWGAA